MRWPLSALLLSALLLAMAIVACAFGAFSTFGDPSHPNHEFLLGVFILLICVSAVAAVFGLASLRGAFIGTSLFGVAYLIIVLHCGFGVETNHDSKWLASSKELGFALFGISFLASKLSQIVTWPSTNPLSSQIVNEESHALEPGRSGRFQLECHHRRPSDACRSSDRNMSWFPHSMMIALACVLAIGCSRPFDEPQSSLQQHRFLGIPDNETSKEGAVGLIGGKSIQVSSISKVQEVPYSEYKRAVESSTVAAQEQHDGFVYWAVKEERDVPFDNATAWVTVLERFKSRME